MADISKITTLNGTTYNIKDATARSSIPAAASANPLMDGTVAVGTSVKYAREDHKHPSDTNKVSKSGDTMTGTLTLAANKYYDQDTVSGLDANNSDIIGVNGIYMNDKADDGKEGINFPHGSNWDSLYANNGKLWFSPDRAKGDAQGVEGARELYSRPLYELGTVDIGMRPMVSWARANRLVFLPADQIIIEQTVDGGTTWSSSEVTDSKKLSLFSDQRPVIDLPRIDNARSELCGLRVTFTAMKYDVPSGTIETDKYQYWNKDHVLSQERYTNLREMWFWLGSNGDLLRCCVECATGAKPDTWVKQFDKDVGLIGWSGSDWVRWTGAPTFGGSINQTSNYWNWRVTFWSKKSDNGAFTHTSAQSIYSIAGYGDSAWGTPNGLMKNDHLYTYDANQNATFPAKITAASFTGDLTGNITGNSTGVSSSGNATNSTARHVWFSDSTTETKRAYNDNFKYTPSTNTISANISGTVNNHTVNSDVPENAVFTDTKNTTGSTNTSSKIFLIGATSQAANPKTYSHDTAYVGTDGCLYSGGTKVLTAHQDISGKADKSATVSTVDYDSTNKKLTKTINGTTSDIVTVATLKTALSLAKGDVGLDNVENKSSATIRGELTKANVTDALGYTPPTSDTNTHRPIQVNGTEILGNNTTALNLKAGSNVTITNSSGTVTIAATNAQTVTGVKGDAETTYRTGDVNLTPANIGAAAASHTHNYAGSASAGGPATMASGIPFGTTDNTSTKTAFTAQIEGITALEDGVICYIMNDKVTSAADCTMNINGLGAKPMYMCNAKATRVTTQFAVNYTWQLVYNSTRVSGGCWDLVYLYNTNTTYSGMTDAEITAGTGTTNRLITPARLKTAIQTWAPTIFIDDTQPSSPSAGDVWFKIVS